MKLGKCPTAVHTSYHGSRKRCQTGHVCTVFIPSNVWSRKTNCICLQLLWDILNNNCIV